MVHVGKYTIHGCYGTPKPLSRFSPEKFRSFAGKISGIAFICIYMYLHEANKKAGIIQRWWFRNPVNSPVDMVNRPIIYRYLQGFLHPNGGWPWYFWTINSSELPLSSWHWPHSASKERIRCGLLFKKCPFQRSRMCLKWTKPRRIWKAPYLEDQPYLADLLTMVINHLLNGMIFQVLWYPKSVWRKLPPWPGELHFWGPFFPTVFFQTASKSHYTEGPIWVPGVQVAES